MDLFTTESQVFLAVVASVTWTTICAVVESNITFKQFKPKTDHDLKNRFVAIIHGLVTCILAGYNLLHDQPSYTAPNSEFQIFLMLISMGYFFYDFAACFYYKIADLPMVVHHVLISSAYIASLYYGTSVMCMTALFYGEISNGVMHARVIIRTFELRYTSLYEVTDTVYLVVFSVARGIFVTKAIYDTIFISEIAILIRGPCVCLWLLSLYFIYEMIGILIKKNRQSGERKKKGIQYFWFSENPEVKKLSYYRKETKEAEI